MLACMANVRMVDLFGVLYGRRVPLFLLKALEVVVRLGTTMIQQPWNQNYEYTKTQDSFP